MDTTTALLIEAERYIELEDADRAAVCFKTALDLDESHSPLPSVGLARIALMVGRVEDAQRLLDHVLQQHPKCAEALTYRGVVADAREDAEGALKYLERAVAQRGDFVPALANLGRVQGQLGRWQDALRSFKRASELAPGKADLVPLLALAAARTGDHGEAIRALVPHLEQNPNHIDGIVTLADVLVDAKMITQAADLLANAVSRFPAVAVLHARQSSLALRSGNLALAREAAERQVSLTPGDEDALLYAATLDMMELDLNKAEARVQQVLAINQANWRAHYQLGLIYDALKIRHAAKVAYGVAMRCGPKAWQPRNNLATLLLEERTPAAAREALSLLNEALTLGPVEELLDVHYNLALAFWQLGELKNSEQAAREVARSPRNCSVVTNAKRFLQNFATV